MVRRQGGLFRRVLQLLEERSHEQRDHLEVLRDPDAVHVHEGWFQDLWDKAEVRTVEGRGCDAADGGAEEAEGSEAQPFSAAPAQEAEQRSAPRRQRCWSRSAASTARVCPNRRWPRLASLLVPATAIMPHEPLPGSVSRSAPSDEAPPMAAIGWVAEVAAAVPLLMRAGRCC